MLGSESKFRISDEILEAHIRQYIEGQRGDEVVFSWQGGEPTLLGVEFFEKVVALEKKYQRPGLHIENDLQTNGTLLNDEWYAFLRENKFLVGLSIDGPQELHDRYRVNKGGAADIRQSISLPGCSYRSMEFRSTRSQWSIASMPRSRWMFIAS